MCDCPRGPGERRDASEATPVNFEASERAIAPLSPPIPSDFPAGVSPFLASLPSSHDSFLSAIERKREKERHVGLTLFPFRSAGTVLSVV